MTDREEIERSELHLESEDEEGDKVSVKDKELTTNVDKHVVDDETVDKNYEFEVETAENFSGLSTDEILAMYENVDVSEDDLIPVEEIMKIYETCNSGAEDFPTKKTTRKLKNKRFQKTSK